MPRRAPRPRPSNIAYNAPLAVADPISLRTKGFGTEAAKAYRHNAVESRSFTVGPMPPRFFLGCFFDDTPFESSTRRLSGYKEFESIPSQGSSTLSLCQTMVAILNKKSKSRCPCPGFIFDIPTSSASSRHTAKLKPSICCYTKDNLDIVKTAVPPHRLELGYTELFIEVKADPASDFFVDPPKEEDADVDAPQDEDADVAAPQDEEADAETHQNNDADAEAMKGEDADMGAHELLFQSEDEVLVNKADKRLGRHVGYATEILARQHRSFLFSISMSGSFMRFFRWDRVGCIVTESFDIREEPELLCEFLWRFSQASHAGRGHDMTVEVATHAEELLFKAAIQEYVGFQLDLAGDALEQAVLEHYVPGRAAAVHVLSQGCPADPGNIRRYIVSRPVVAPLHLTGRGTRGYWAVDVSDRRVVFIKDTWRNCEIMAAWEGNTLERMHDQGVSYIPSVVCHGDLPDCFPDEPRLITRDEYQCTATDEFRGKPWVCQVNGQTVRVYKQVHYRLVLGTVGYSLRRFKDTEELMHVTYDIFTAMREARTKASRIHRDISLGNVVLVRERDQKIRRGYLIDWEASCEVDSSGQACFPGRTGTWLFMSQRMLSHDNVNEKMTLEDDMESLLYVILYTSLRWLPHNYPDRYLHKLFYNFFEDQADFGGVPHGGLHKLANARGRATTREVVFKDASFHEWLNTVMDYHCPPKKLQKELEGRWSDPSFLNSYWSELLRTRQLAQNDRVDHPVDPPRRANASSTASLSESSVALTPLPAVPDVEASRSNALGKRRRGSREASAQAERLSEPPPVKRRSKRDVPRVDYTPYLQRSTRRKK